MLISNAGFGTLFCGLKRLCFNQRETKFGQVWAISHTNRMIPPEIWMQQVFEAKAARQGGVVRRSRRDIDRTVGWSMFEAELMRRGFHAVENSGKVVIFCNNAPIQVLV